MRVRVPPALLRRAPSGPKEEGMAPPNDTLRIRQTTHSPRLALDVQVFVLDAQARKLASGT